MPPFRRCSIDTRLVSPPPSARPPFPSLPRRILLLVLHLVLYLAIADRALAILLLLRTSGDIEAHAQIASICIRENLWPANPGMYLLVALFGHWGAPAGDMSAGGRAAITHLSYVLINVLILAVVAKVILTRRILAAEWQIPRHSVRHAAAATLAALVLLAAFSLPVRHDLLYLGQFPPTVWHNSTTIALMPLALSLFYCSYRFLQSGSLRLALATAGLCLANIFIKPSFILPFIIIFPAFALARFRFSRATLATVGICVLCVGALAWQTYYTYYHAPLLDQFYRERYPLWEVNRERIEISFLTIWRLYSANLPLSLLCSIAFPLAYALAFPVRAARDYLFLYAAALFAAALLITCALLETGFRKADANFFWQTIIANYLLFTATLISIFRPAPLRAAPATTAGARASTRENRKWFLVRRVFVLAVLALHLMAGLLYLQRVLATGQYR